jgi:hypothetical protein
MKCSFLYSAGHRLRRIFRQIEEKGRASVLDHQPAAAVQGHSHVVRVRADESREAGNPRMTSRPALQRPSLVVRLEVVFTGRAGC